MIIADGTERQALQRPNVGMIFPVALRICAILSRIARQRCTGDGVTPRARVTEVCFVHAASEHISSIAQERLARAFTLHTKRVEQFIVADHDFHRLIRPQTVGKIRLADLGWIIRPLIAVSDKVRRRHPFNDKSIRGTGFSGNDIDGYV